MPQYRVGKDGVLIIQPDGGRFSLPPGTVLDEIPEGYEGKLEVIVETKQEHGYADKMIRTAEDKATPARRPDPRLSNCVLEGGRQKHYPAEDK